jgi:hypothetical protein
MCKSGSKHGCLTTAGYHALKIFYILFFIFEIINNMLSAHCFDLAKKAVEGCLKPLNTMKVNDLT